MILLGISGASVSAPRVSTCERDATASKGYDDGRSKHGIPAQARKCSHFRRVLGHSFSVLTASSAGSWLFPAGSFVLSCPDGGEYLELVPVRPQPSRRQSSEKLDRQAARSWVARSVRGRS